jgi:glycosyltransferase involved in cell wall biosynthesis
MRVLMTADAVGGVWTYALELVEALRPHGVEVVVATMGPRPAHVPDGVDVRHGDYALEWMDDPWSDVDRAGDWLLALEDDVRPDVVHLNGFSHASLPWAAPALVVAHSDVLSWWHAVRGEAAPPQWAEYRRRVGQGLRAARSVVAPTAAMLDALHRGHEFDGGVVVPNGRSRRWAPPPTSKDALVLSAGRLWDEAKNVSALARVASRLSWPVVLAGDTGGQHYAGVEQLGRLAFPELAAWLNRSPLFCLPARYEPFGLGPLEAALCGCALVLGDIASLREVWGDAAVYVDPDDAHSLAAAVQSLIDDEARRRSLARAAAERAAAYAPDRLAAAYLDVYRALPVGAGAPR